VSYYNTHLSRNNSLRQWLFAEITVAVQKCAVNSVNVTLLSSSPDHLLSHLSKLQTVLFNMQHPTFGINSLNLSVSLIHILVFHLLTTLHMSDTHSPPPLSTSITPSLFHSRLKTHFFLKSSTIDSSTDTHWTDLTDSIPTGPFSLAYRI